MKTKQEWVDPGMVMQLGAAYRHKETGDIMQLEEVDCRHNFIRIVPVGADWEGTSQDFKEQFELVKMYGES